MTAFERRSYTGNAPQVTLAGDMDANTLTFSVADGTGFPDGTAGPFFVVIDRGKTTEEKVHCTGRSFGSFTADQRGADGTSAASHQFGATVELCWTATDADEANQAAHQTVGQVGAAGDLLVGSGANTLTSLPAGAAGDLLTSVGSGQLGWQPPSDHTHAEANITNLTADLAGKAAAVHTHAEGDVTGLATDLAAKAVDSAVVHKAGAETVTGAKLFQTADGSTALVAQAAPAQSNPVAALHDSTGAVLHSWGVDGSHTAKTGPMPFAAWARRYTDTIPAGNSSSGTIFLQIPANRFTVAPVVTATVLGAASGLAGATVQVYNVTASSFDINVHLASPAPAGGIAYEVDLLGVQMYPASASD